MTAGLDSCAFTSQGFFQLREVPEATQLYARPRRSGEAAHCEEHHISVKSPTPLQACAQLSSPLLLTTPAPAQRPRARLALLPRAHRVPQVLPPPLEPVSRCAQRPGRVSREGQRQEGAVTVASTTIYPAQLSR